MEEEEEEVEVGSCVCVPECVPQHVCVHVCVRACVCVLLTRCPVCAPSVRRSSSRRPAAPSSLHADPSTLRSSTHLRPTTRVPSSWNTPVHQFTTVSTGSTTEV